MADTVKVKQIICDICDKVITNPKKNLCRISISGVSRPLNSHPKCVKTFWKCKGDFSKLPNGNLKRIIQQSVAETGDVVNDTNIIIREKQGRFIRDGLIISHEEGLNRIENLAIDFYDLPKPDKTRGEFYTVNAKKHIILMRKRDDASKKDEPNSNTFNITSAERE